MIRFCQCGKDIELDTDKPGKIVETFVFTERSSSADAIIPIERILSIPEGR